MSSEELQDVTCFLKAVADLYPSGIPAALFSPFAPEQGADDPAKCDALLCRGGDFAGVLIVSAGASGLLDFQGEDGKLLRDIIQRGMNLSLAEVVVCALGPGFDGSARREAFNRFWRICVSNRTPKLVMAFGGEAAACISGCLAVESPGDGAALLTPSSLLRAPALEEIRGDRNAKRKFWDDLKSMMSKLGPLS